MASRKTQFGFMALGCLVGLLGVVAITKLLEDSKAAAREGRLPHLLARADEPAKVSQDKPKAQEPPAPPPAAATIELTPPPVTGGASVPPPPPGAGVLLPPATVNAPTPAPLPAIPVPDAALPFAAPSGSPATAGAAAPPPPLPPSVTTKAELPAPMPAEPLMPKAEAKSQPVPPPLPVADSVPPPPNELKPIPAPAGEPLPPLPANASETKVEPVSRPADVKPELIPVSHTPAPAPPSPAPAAVVPIPATADVPAGAPLPPVEAPAPAKKPAVDEPPLAPSPGPVTTYQVRAGGETMREIARRALGSEDRWADVHRLNPTFQADAVLVAGLTIKLPADACVRDDEAVQPLPTMRPKAAPQKAKVVLPLTGTFSANLDDKKTLLLPRAIREQLGRCDTLLVSPGSDECLWVTNQTHLDRLADRLEHSPARELDVRTFKRLYYAQTEKAAVADDGRITVPDRLVQFAGLRQEVVLVGIDDHFELWDAAKWRQYTQQNSAAARAAMADRE